MLETLMFYMRICGDYFTSYYDTSLSRYIYIHLLVSKTVTYSIQLFYIIGILTYIKFINVHIDIYISCGISANKSKK